MKYTYKDVWDDFGSGRTEKRTCHICEGLTFLANISHWKEQKIVKQELIRHF